MKTISTFPSVDADGHLSVVRGLSSLARVDRENHVIYGVALIQSGPLNEGDERPWFIDDVSLSQVLALATTAEKGLKARWTHPNMSRDGMGTYLGRWKNLRLSDDAQTVLADLHLSPLAFKGDDARGSYVEDMAANEPEAFGVSLFPVLDKAAMEQATAVDGKQPMRFRRLVAGDVVDEPAATRGGFFGGKLSIATAPAYATAALDSLFPDSTPEVIRSRTSVFLDTYLASRVDLACTDDVEPELSVPEVAVSQTPLASVDAPSLPSVLPGGIPLAAVEGIERSYLASVLPFIGEYLASAKLYAADRITLASYIDSRIADTDGIPYAGRTLTQLVGSLNSAVTKQSEIVERYYPLAPANGLSH